MIADLMKRKKPDGFRATGRPRSHFEFNLEKVWRALQSKTDLMSYGLKIKHGHGRPISEIYPHLLPFFVF